MLLLTALLLTAEPTRAELERELALLDSQRPSASWFVPLGLAQGFGTAGALIALGTGFDCHASSFISLCYRLFAPAYAVWGFSSAVFVAGIVGMAILIARRAEPTRRIVVLEERLAAAKEAEVRERHEDPVVGVRVNALRRDRPTLGVPVVMMVAAIIGTGLTALSSVPAFQNPNGLLVIPALLLGACITVEALGIWLLVTRVDRRDEIDAELRRLGEDPRDGTPAPVGSVIESRLPPAPTVLGYAWSF